MKKHIPNAITCCNLICGCIATVQAIQGHADVALLFIVIGAIFDFFDGMTARLLHVSSPIGKELDSLADVVTFGVAPSAIIFAYLQSEYSTAEASMAFIMAAFSALRLAKFNLDERQALGFIGLPTPANALFWGALSIGIDGMEYAPYIVMAAVPVSCYLLVSEIPMFALKFKSWGWKGNEVKYIFLLTCIPLFVIPLILFQSIIGLAAVIAWYVILSVCTQRSKN